MASDCKQHWPLSTSVSLKTVHEALGTLSSTPFQSSAVVVNPEGGLTTRCEAPRTAENSSGPPTSSSSMSGPRSRPMSTPLVRRRMPPRSMPSSAERFQGSGPAVGSLGVERLKRRTRLGASLRLVQQSRAQVVCISRCISRHTTCSICA